MEQLIHSDNALFKPYIVRREAYLPLIVYEYGLGAVYRPDEFHSLFTSHGKADGAERVTVYRSSFVGDHRDRYQICIILISGLRIEYVMIQFSVYLKIYLICS